MHPCFGLSLQAGVQFIAVLDTIVSTLTVISVSLQDTYAGRWVVVGLESGNVVGSIVLGIGASKRCPITCKCWVVYTCMTSFTIVTHMTYKAIAGKISGWALEDAPAELVVTFTYLVIYKVYAVFVVLRLIAEIEKCGGLNEVLVHLSDKDVEEFLYGTLQNKVETGNKKKVFGLHEPYDKKYEILLTELEIETNLLGSGKFGRIHSGYLHVASRNSHDATGEKRRVAVKTLHDSQTSLTYFKALLSELKIMIYLGQHPNIVSLIGVCTSEIQKKKLWIVLELCELGSLHNFLRHFQRFADLATKSTETNPGGILDISEAYKWAVQIAQGLEFMRSKGVVHGDISLRNILLTVNHDAKVSDFGLSRKLMQSRCKFQCGDVPLPWRWMAIESLQRLEFSSATDVWSYGVTLWEIFTFGAIPFEAATWNTDFVKQLVMGCRLSRPEQAPEQMYDLMLKCWQRNPTKRPTFLSILTELQKLS